MVYKPEKTSSKICSEIHEKCGTMHRQSHLFTRITKGPSIFKDMIYGCIYCKILTDANGNATGYSVIAINDAMIGLMGNYSPACSDKRVKDFFYQVDLISILAEAALKGVPSVLEQYLNNRQKWYTISVFSPAKLYAVLLIEDITERKLLEEKLIQSRKRYEALLKQSSDAIALVDSISKKIVEVNSRLCQMTGYSEKELCRMNIYDLFAGSPQEIQECQDELATKHCVPTNTRILNCKDGTMLEVERLASLINYNSHYLELMTFYGISEERKLQQIIKEEATLASQVQQRMLPADFKNEVIEIQGIYKPLHMLSGDFFDYRLSENGTALTGFLVDVAGHGLATAFKAAAVNVLLQEIIIHEKMPSKNKLKKLNKQMRGHFDEGSFAALLIFHFDFRKKRLKCAFCGINQILAFGSMKRGWVKAKGSFIGAFDDPIFDFSEIPIEPGDCFYFLTDGISEKIKEPFFDDLNDFSATVRNLTDLADSREIKDDCSAICIRLNDSPAGCKYFFTGVDEVENLQQEIRRKLTAMVGNKAVHLQIALNEAINNILFHGSGTGYFKIKKLGKRIILRVKDCKLGFNAHAVLHRFFTQSTNEIIETDHSTANGRGILIMKLFTDRIYYNRSGSEVMLISMQK